MLRLGRMLLIGKKDASNPYRNGQMQTYLKLMLKMATVIEMVVFRTYSARSTIKPEFEQIIIPRYSFLLAPGW